MCFSFIQEMQAVINKNNNVKSLVGNFKIVKTILPYWSRVFPACLFYFYLF